MAVKKVPEGHHRVSPYLIVDGAERALDFYKKAFGGGTVVMLADVHPDFGPTWHISTHIEDVSDDELDRRAKEAMAPHTTQ